MKPKAVAVLAFAFSLVLSLQAVDFASANYFPPPSIEIYQPYSGVVCSNSSVLLQVRVNVLPHEWVTSISYSIDGGKQVRLSNLTREENLWYWTETKGVLANGQGFSAAVTIDDLSEGNHTLTVYSRANGEEMSQAITFTVDFDYVPPQNPYSLPSGISNNTTPMQETSQINKDTFQPFQNWLPLIFAAVSAALFSLIVSALLIKKRRR
jgi:hypothetical protein